MSVIRLIQPSKTLEAEIQNMKREFYDAGERVIYGGFKLDNDHIPFDVWLNILEEHGRETTDPVSKVYLGQLATGEIVGILNFRHADTGFYQSSGHIGYSVRPSMRGHGYAAAMLRETLTLARELRLPAVRLVCRADNEASRRTILACGGVLNRSFMDGGRPMEEYEITL